LDDCTVGVGFDSRCSIERYVPGNGGEEIKSSGEDSSPRAVNRYRTVYQEGFKMRLRTHGVQMTNEASVLRRMRMECGLSLRTAGELFGKSASYLAQVENGRMKPPTGENLKRLLGIYGGPKLDSFYRRVTDYCGV